MPSQTQIEVPLLLEIQAAGGEAEPRELYSRVAAHFPELMPEEMEEVLPNYPSVKRWNNRVQWARQKLVEKGELYSLRRGIWALTDKGRARLKGRENDATLSRGVPVEKTLEELVEEHEEALRRRLLTRVRELDPHAFEKFAKRLLEALGFSKVVVTARTRDDGIDGHGQYRQGIVAVNAAYQCKRWQHSVSRPDIDKFRGAIAGSFDLGVYITTSSFTRDAQEVSVKPGTVTVVLVDGKAIANLMVRYEIGLRRRVMQVGTVDEAFFESLSEEEPS